MQHQEIYLIRANGERVIIPASAKIRIIDKKVTRLQKENRTQGTIIKTLLVIILALLVGLVAMVRYTGTRIDGLKDELESMNDEYQSQIWAMTRQYEELEEAYTDLNKRYEDLGEQYIAAQEKIREYEMIMPTVNGSWSYFNPAIPLTATLQAFTYQIGDEYGVDPEVLFGIMRKESGFDPKAISGDGHDYGICQVRDRNHNWLRRELGNLNFLDAEDNITAAAFMIRNIIDQYGYTEWNHILVVYNMGPGNAAAYFANGNTSSDYSKLVLSYAKEYGYNGNGYATT